MGSGNINDLSNGRRNVHNEEEIGCVDVRVCMYVCVRVRVCVCIYMHRIPVT